VAWGSNSSGQLGDGTTVNKISPVQIGTSSWSVISAGDFHSMGILTTGVLYTGDNTSGKLGRRFQRPDHRQLRLEHLLGHLFDAGANHSLAILSNNGVLIFMGANSSGQLGDLSTLAKSTPVLVSGPVGVSWAVISAGSSHPMGILTTGVLYSWVVIHMAI
jgi:alpha-tubulin suppressor-like RCC1 family protein